MISLCCTTAAQPTARRLGFFFRYSSRNLLCCGLVDFNHLTDGNKTLSSVQSLQVDLDIHNCSQNFHIINIYKLSANSKYMLLYVNHREAYSKTSCNLHHLHNFLLSLFQHRFLPGMLQAESSNVIILFDVRNHYTNPITCCTEVGRMPGALNQHLLQPADLHKSSRDSARPSVAVL